MIGFQGCFQWFRILVACVDGLEMRLMNFQYFLMSKSNDMVKLRNEGDKENENFFFVQKICMNLYVFDRHWGSEGR